MSILRTCRHFLNIFTRRFVRFNSNCDPKTETQKSLISKRLFLIPGIGILLSLGFYFKKDKKPESEMEEIQRYRDPLMGKDTAMVRISGFWVPQYLYNSSSSGFADIENFNIRDDDVIVASFPKSGTTWVQEVVTLIQDKHCNQTGNHGNMEERFPYLEYVYPGLKQLAGQLGPRRIKTHLPYILLPKSVRDGKGKVIYIARNAKDVSVSYYHFVKMFTISNYKGCFDEFLDKFLSGKVNYGPWSDHVLSFWRQRNQENVLFITYEDMHKSPHATIRTIASHLDVNLSDEEVGEIVRGSSFETMKNNPASNYSWWDNVGLRNKNQTQFMRKGKVGDWQVLYTEEMREDVEKLCKSKLEPEGLVFKDR